jgi:hypothetical protein
VSENILKKIDNTVLDLQASHYQTYESELKKLARLLNDETLYKFNKALIENVNLEEFLVKSAKTQGSMVGSAKLEWPDDDIKSLGLKYLLIQKLGNDENFAFNFSHTFYSSGRKIIDQIHTLVRHLIIPFIRDYKQYIYSFTENEVAKVMPITNNKVFIVHGHDEAVLYKVARVIEQLSLDPIILHEQADRGRTIIEKFEVNSEVGFAIVLLTPDDSGKAKNEDEYSLRARQNVILELGYFMGKIGRDRVCALKLDNVEIPSDIFGVIWTDLDPSGIWKYKLGKELIAAGYNIDLSKIK